MDDIYLIVPSAPADLLVHIVVYFLYFHVLLNTELHGYSFLLTNQILNYDGKIPKEVTIEDKTTIEQMQLLQQLEKEDKKTVFRIIDKMLTNKKFKDFFNKNVDAL